MTEQEYTILTNRVVITAARKVLDVFCQVKNMAYPRQGGLWLPLNYQ